MTPVVQYSTVPARVLSYYLHYPQIQYSTCTKYSTRSYKLTTVINCTILEYEQLEYVLRVTFFRTCLQCFIKLLYLYKYSMMYCKSDARFNFRDRVNLNRYRKGTRV
jgi:hypothetical protein